MLDLILFVWIFNGSQRKAIIKALGFPMTPREIRQRSLHYNKKISLNHTSDVLRAFVCKGLAVCLTPEKRKGRIYRLTQEGEEIRTTLLKMQQKP